MNVIISLLILAGMASAQWPMDGGSTSRMNSINLYIDTSNPAVHSTFSAGEPVDDTASQIEGYLLNSILVTSAGYVVIASDDCKIRLYEDPGSLSSISARGASLVGSGGFNIWVPLATFDVNATDIMYHPDECEYAGLVLDTVGDMDVAYFLDGRNKAVHAVNIVVDTMMGDWSVKGTFTNSVFDLDVSMLVIPDTDTTTKQLWIPLQASFIGSDGLAVIVGLAPTAEPPSPAYKSMNTFVPKPPACSYPGDDGSVLIDGQYGPTVVQLSSEEGCGLIAITVSDLSVAYQDNTDYVFTGEDGVHSQPAYDSNSGSLFFLNFADYNNTQQLCCLQAASLSQACSSWSSICVSIPSIGSYPYGDQVINGNWQWLGLATYNGAVVVSASGAKNDDLVMARFGIGSALFVFSASSGYLLSSNIVDDDLYNSAPLIVVPIEGLTDTRIFVTSAKGVLTAYLFPDVSTGPLWSQVDFPVIPDEDLPLTTYAFLSVTETGTILATSSAGGVEWQDEKAFVALANGVFDPTVAPTPSFTSTPSPSPTNDVLVLSQSATPTNDALVLTLSTTPTPTLTPSTTRSHQNFPVTTKTASTTPSALPSSQPPPGLSSGASAGIALGVIGVSAAGFFLAYTRVPVVTTFVNSAVTKVTGGRGSYSGLGQNTSGLQAARASYTPDRVSERTSIFIAK